MFATRLISGILLLAAAVVCVCLGGPVLFAVTAVISFIGLFEFYRVLAIEKKAVAVAGYLAAAGWFLLLYLGQESRMTFVFIALLMVLMAIYVFTFPKYRTEEITEAFFGVCYVPVMLSFLYQTRQMEDGFLLAWLIFASSWGCDTCAYCVGRLFGRHKLAPVLSPKKSIEGAVGGVVGAALIGFLLGVAFQGGMELDNSPLVCALACAIGAAISQIGDLAASAVKRNHNIKDYGNLIPGHGGILDRFDSMIFTAPAIYFAIIFLR